MNILNEPVVFLPKEALLLRTGLSLAVDTSRLSSVVQLTYGRNLSISFQKCFQSDLSIFCVVHLLSAPSLLLLRLCWLFIDLVGFDAFMVIERYLDLCVACQPLLHPDQKRSFRSSKNEEYHLQNTGPQMTL